MSNSLLLLGILSNYFSYTLQAFLSFSYTEFKDDVEPELLVEGIDDLFIYDSDDRYDDKNVDPDVLLVLTSFPF